VLTDRKSWDEIPYKALQAPPQVLFVDEGYPLATLYFYPTPDQAYTGLHQLVGAAAEHRGAHHAARAAAWLQQPDRERPRHRDLPGVRARGAGERGAPFNRDLPPALARELRDAGALYAGGDAAAQA
jgi:hypothetical protein